MIALLRKSLLPVAQLAAGVRAGRWRGVRFLCYHSVVDSLQSDPAALTLIVSRAGFKRQLELIRRSAYEVVSMDTALRLIETGGAGAGQFVCITFDDGRIDNFDSAWPLLREFGFAAHFFVSSARLGQTLEIRAGGRAITDRYMDDAMVRAIVREGGSVGSHGREHVDLTTLDDAALSRELTESRAVLADATGAPVLTHAYPFARHNARVLRATRAAGYAYAFGVAPGTVTRVAAGSDAALVLPRNLMRSGIDAPENHATLRGGFDFMRGYATVKTWLEQS